MNKREDEKKRGWKKGGWKKEERKKPEELLNFIKTKYLKYKLKVKESMLNPNTDNFQFKGFYPSDKLRTYCKEIYSLVEDKAPSDGILSASIKKTNSGYEGFFKVASAYRIFKVDSKSVEPFSLIEELNKKIELHILDWHDSRKF